MNTLQSISMKTPDGVFTIIIDEKGVARVSGYGDINALAKRLPDELRDSRIESVQKHPYEAFVNAYYSGDTEALAKIPQDQDGTDFQKSIWREISRISYGHTISYKELALRADYPDAIRGAGTVCGLNRLILLVPCHRVIKSDGGLGGYLYGKTIKESLLRHERTV